MLNYGFPRHCLCKHLLNCLSLSLSLSHCKSIFYSIYSPSISVSVMLILFRSPSFSSSISISIRRSQRKYM